LVQQLQHGTLDFTLTARRGIVSWNKWNKNSNTKNSNLESRTNINVCRRHSIDYKSITKKLKQMKLAFEYKNLQLRVKNQYQCLPSQFNRLQINNNKLPLRTNGIDFVNKNNGRCMFFSNAE
jgi:hypothetical protein